MNVHTESSPQSSTTYGQTLLQLFILGLFCAFSLRLWYLQVHKGEFYATKALDNRQRQEMTYAPRGLIHERGGNLVAINEPAYALALVREDCHDLEATLAQVASWTGVAPEQLRRTVERGRKRVKPFEPLILVSDVSFATLARIESNALRWPGLEVLVRAKRYYPQGPLLAHILGYVAEASESDLEADPTLAVGDTVGKGGLEGALEDRLRGEKGLRQNEVDASGRRFNSLVLKDSRSGDDLRLSIDLKLQTQVEHAFKAGNLAGVVVVLEPTTGQILAMVSEPVYDNNAFAKGLSGEEWQRLRQDPLHPLQNRAIQSVYPPGSVFKLLVAACGLSEGLIEPERTIHCSGATTIGNKTFRCWKKSGHGSMNLERALIESCDVYFYEQGKTLGVDRIERFAKQCGFGAVTGVDLPHEKPGLIPSREWKRKRFGEPWQQGENLNLAIGQGYTLTSPLQIARFVAALLNGGELLKPTLVATDSPVVQARLPVSRGHIQRILAAMKATVDSEQGTAKKLRTPGVAIGGKTGTAQVVRLTDALESKKTAQIPYKYRDHAWIASWGQAQGRSVVVVCMVEHGGHGGEAAVPVAKAVYDTLFGPEPTQVADWPKRPAETPAEPVKGRAAGAKAGGRRP